MWYLVVVYLIIGLLAFIWTGRDSVSSLFALLSRRAHVYRGNKPLVLSAVMLLVIAALVLLFVVLLAVLL